MAVKKGTKFKKTLARVGERYFNKYSGWYEIVASEGDSKFTVVFDNTGYVKPNNFLSAITKGLIRDDSLVNNFVSKDRYPVGHQFTMQNGTIAEVVEVLNFEQIKVRWLETGVESVHESRNLKKGKINCLNGYSGWNYLYVDESKGVYYVYFVYDNDYNICYIGSGTGSRYTHTDSGISHSYNLNKMHFTGVETITRIFKGGLSITEARDLERELILQHRPYCNISMLKTVVKV